jgi:hypothetical protein
MLEAGSDSPAFLFIPFGNHRLPDHLAVADK